MPEKIELLADICPHCQKQVNYLWDEGVIPNESYVLIANWLYHRECWQKTEKEIQNDQNEG